MTARGKIGAVFVLLGIIFALIPARADFGAGGQFQGFWAGRAGTPFSISFKEHRHSGANPGSPQNYTSVDFGAADSTRRIIVCTTADDSGGAAEVNSMTIGGVSATQIIAAPASGGIVEAQIWIAAVPTGTSGTVSITWGAGSGPNQNSEIAVWAGYGFGSSTAYASGSDVVFTSDTLTVSSIEIPTGGGGIGCAAVWGDSSTPSSTWTNLTEDFDDGCAGADSRCTHTGAQSTTAGTADRSVQSSVTMNNDSNSLVVATWGP